MVSLPTFRRRGAATPSISTPVSIVVPFASASASAPVLVVVPAPPLFSLVDEDVKVSPHDGDLHPHKRKSMDAGEGVSLVVYSV